MSVILGSLRLLGLRKKLVIGFLGAAMVMVNFLDLIAITLIGIVGSLSLGGNGITIPDWLEGMENQSLLMLLLGGAACLFAVKTAMTLILERSQNFFLARLEVEFSGVISRHVFSSDWSSVKNISRADLDWSILRSTGYAFTGVLGQALQLLSHTSLALLIIFLFFLTDWVSALAVLAYFSLVLTLFQVATKRSVSDTGASYASGSISVSQSISDLLTAYKEIAVQAKLDFFITRVHEARARAAFSAAKYGYLQSLPRLIVELALIAGTIGFAAFHFIRDDGNPDFGLISLFIIGSLRMMSALLPLSRSLLALRHDAPLARSSQKTIREVLRGKEFDSQGLPNWSEGGSQLAAHALRGPVGVEFTNVSFCYEDADSQPFIEGLTLSIPPGSLVAIIGPSGAGKSTVIDLILGLYAPTAGSVLCSGSAPRMLRQLEPGILSYVPQKTGLIKGSIRENIALGVPDQHVRPEALDYAMRVAQLKELVDSLPAGVDTEVGAQGSNLSGGQIQRIGLARALYTRPKLLVLDEATSALDPETEALITNSLQTLSGHCTRVVVAHRLSTVQNADLVFVLNGGKLIASGRLNDLEKRVPMVKNYIELMKIRF